MPNPFTEPGEWLRGNLHTHTTNSDGPLSPQETVNAYAELGYDFLAITDHNCLTRPEELNNQGITLLSGVELNPPGGNLGQDIHLVALGIEQVPQVPEGLGPPETMTAISSQSEVCFVAHPYWSLLEAGEIRLLDGYVGLEVYNQTCQRLNNHGTSEVQWDLLLAHTCPVWGVAVDDCHRLKDMGRGWIMLKSEERSPVGILAALGQGYFYASTGPQLHEIEKYGENLRIACSPCQQAAVVAAMPGVGATTWYMEELARPFTEILLPIPTAEVWLRVEVIDQAGRKAWSNPFRAGELE